ncbi:pancreatic lipase-related protein 2 isoform X1 [Ixodes scapularis]|uniref:pancreatic lipase-related protein 2 isoform X1 n=1 Tax=Ixodes scapularis TaxID=6945 RepID=UPI001C390DC9|nr:pancreatic lipase-related protein 2 isoform X1 [Ixodes scapularis]
MSAPVFLTALAVTLVGCGTYVKAELKCYDELGCLETGGAFFDEIRRPFILTPHDRDMIKVQYLLYTRDRPEATMLCWNSSLETVRDSPFNASRPTKFIVHGYLDTVYFGEWMTEMKNAYLKNADMNVFIVDWSGGNGPGYETAVVNARIAGAEIAFLVRKLEVAFGANASTMHIIGHSLGAHVAGYAGLNITRLGRITALDPAEPFFEGMPPEVRVDRSDADFVDVIHTDSHPYLSKLGVSEGMGMEEAVGHVDFYPNGGQIMPGCDLPNRWLSLIKGGFIKGLREILGCHHQRAVHYMLDSIENQNCVPLSFECPSYEAFKKGQCRDCGEDGSACAPMGEQADVWRPHKQDRERRMYGVTNAHKPFCAYQYLVTIRTGDQVKRANAEGIISLTTKQGGKSVTFKVNKRLMEFRPNSTYTFLTTSPAMISDYTKLTLRFKSTLIFTTANLPLLDVQIQPLTANVPKSMAKAVTRRFCPPWDPQGISSFATVTLKKC